MIIRSREQQFWSKIDVGELDECWPWMRALFSSGYGRIKVQYKSVLAHRQAWILIHGSIPDGLQVLHTCDNRRCCNPAHLFLGTHKVNMEDKVAKGRQFRPTGERNGSAKLTLVEAREIRELAGTATHAEIAERYGISRRHVGNIISGKLWKEAA